MNRLLIALLILIGCTAAMVSIVRHRAPEPAAPVVAQQDQAPDVERVKEPLPAVATTEADVVASPPESRAPARVRIKRKAAAPVAAGDNPPMDANATAGTVTAGTGAAKDA